MSEQPPKEYEVGKGKPPKHSQFRPGESGNPNGRPKGSRNFMTLLEEELEEGLTVSENGCQVRITKRQAIVKQLVNQGVKGNPSAWRHILGLLIDDDSEQRADPFATPSDEAVMKVIRERDF